MIRTPAQIIRDFRKGKKGFTLIEVLIATALFTTVSLIGVIIFTDVAHVQRRIYLESALYEDGRFLMERIAREIRQNTVDYDEYYNRVVENGVFGDNFGCYTTRFYNPGDPKVIGATCSAKPAGGDPAFNPGCVINKNTLDINTGRNPYMGIDAFSDGTDANAFCDTKYHPGLCDPDDVDLYRRDQLYLIDATGRQKTILALKKVNASPVENALSMIKLDGVDANKDGIYEEFMDATHTPPQDFYCDPAYDCVPGNFAPSYKLEETLDASLSAAKLWQGFVPISPLRSNIRSIYFFVSPLEDPRKAFAETDPAEGMMQQPHVTVILTLEPSAAQLSGFGGTTPRLTLQETVSSRVYNEVKTYTGEPTCPLYL